MSALLMRCYHHNNGQINGLDEGDQIAGLEDPEIRAFYRAELVETNRMILEALPTVDPVKAESPAL